jgi:hypothetical protein
LDTDFLNNANINENINWGFKDSYRRNKPFVGHGKLRLIGNILVLWTNKVLGYRVRVIGQEENIKWLRTDGLKD